MNIVQTERLTIRLIELEDYSMILSLFNEPAVLKFIGDKNIRNNEDAINYIKTGPLHMQKTLGFSLYVCEIKSTGELIGLSGLIKRDGIQFPEVGFAFLNKFTGMGFGFESVNAVIKYSESVLNLDVLQAICNPDNKVSISLLTKLGFSFKDLILLKGTDDQVNLYQKDLLKN